MEVMEREVAYFKASGGSCIVDQTPVGLSPSPSKLREISQRTGVHVVASTGYYVPECLSPDVLNSDVKRLAQKMILDITDGFSGTDVRAGIIGEIGAPGDFSEIEKKVLQAVAICQKETGSAVMLHTANPNNLVKSPRKLSWGNRALEVLSYLEKHGVNLERIIVGHADGSVRNTLQEHVQILKRGAYIEYDGFQQEFPYDAYNSYQMSDWNRVQNLVELVSKGHIGKLLISNDVWQKIMLIEYGGWGYAHIIENICPMLTKNGLSQEEVNQILIDNPRRLLGF